MQWRRAAKKHRGKPMAVKYSSPVARRGLPQNVGRTWGAPVALLLLLLYNAFFTKFFLTGHSIDVLLTQIAPIVVVGVGMTLVIATGGIDLSVGSLMAIAGALAPLLFSQHHGIFAAPGIGTVLACLAALTLAALLGLFNGVLVTVFRIQPIIATLVLFIAGRGIAQVLTNGRIQTFHNPGFQVLGTGHLLGVPLQVVLMVLIVLGAAWAIRATAWGRYVLASGDNEAAARLSGVPVDRVKRTVYILSGLLAGLAGLLAVSINSASDAGTVGLLMELNAIAAVAVGGTPLTGGRASVFGTLVGGAIVQLVQFSLVSHNVPEDAAKIVDGAIIVLAVVLQRQRRQ